MIFGRILMADRVLSKVVGVASKENILEILAYICVNS